MLRVVWREVGYGSVVCCVWCGVLGVVWRVVWGEVRHAIFYLNTYLYPCENTQGGTCSHRRKALRFSAAHSCHVGVVREGVMDMAPATHCS